MLTMFILKLISYLILKNEYTWWVHLYGCISKSSMEDALIFQTASNPSEYLVFWLISPVHITNDMPLVLSQVMQFLKTGELDYWISQLLLDKLRECFYWTLSYNSTIYCIRIYVIMYHENELISIFFFKIWSNGTTSMSCCLLDGKRHALDRQ